jgi:hypothetical protein
MSSESRPHRALASNPPALGLRGLDIRRAYVAAVTSLRTESADQSETPAKPTPKSLEGLLLRASELLTGVSARDPRSRLLQTALLRRDHALLAIVVRSFGETSTNAATTTLWSTSQPPPPRRAVRHASERPTCRPPRRDAAE